MICPVCTKPVEDHEVVEFHYHSYIVPACDDCVRAHAFLQARRLDRASNRTAQEEHWINTFQRRIAAAVSERSHERLLDWAREHMSEIPS